MRNLPITYPPSDYLTLPTYVIQVPKCLPNAVVGTYLPTYLNLLDR